MESNESLSQIDTKLLEDLSLVSNLPSTTFKKKSFINPNSIKTKLKVISNYITISPDRDIKFYLYTITIEGCHHEEVKHALLRAFRLNQGIRSIFKDLFSFYEFTGHGMFCIPRTNLMDKLKFCLKFAGNTIEHIKEEHYKLGLEQEDIRERLYLLTMSRKNFAITSENQLSYGENPDMSRQVLNLYIKSLLTENGYSKSNTGVYFKLRSNERKSFEPIDTIQVSHNQAFVKGYRITSLLNEQNLPLIRINTKFRLLHNLTFGQVYEKHLGCNKPKFLDFCRRTRGIKVYGNEEIRKIDDVIYKKPSEVFFEHKKHGDISVLNYMSVYYGIKLDDVVQPIIVKKSKKNVKEMVEGQEVKKEVEIVLYYLPQFLYVAGNLPDQDKVNLNKYVNMSASNTYVSTLKILDDLKSSQVGSKLQVHSNFLPLQVDAVLLKNPVLEFKEGQDAEPSDDGRIDTKSKMARDTPTKLDYVIVYNRDISEDQANEMTDRLFQDSQLVMPGVLANNPKEFIYLNYSTRHLDVPYITNEINTKVIDRLKLIEEDEKKAKAESKTIVFFLIPDKDESYYKIIKTVFNASKLKYQNQVLCMKKLQKKNVTVSANIFFQVLAKYSYAPWRFRPVNKDIQQKTMIITYSVGLGIISLSFSLNSDFTKNHFIQKRYTVKSKYLCQDVGIYFERALLDFAKGTGSKRDIDNIIIYREGLNKSQLIHFEHYELSNIKERLAKAKQSQELIIFSNAELCVIIVYPDNDTRLFLLDEQSGIEINRGDVSIRNNPVGLLVDNSLVLKDKQEFYLVSSYNSEQCNNPTKYQIYFDNTTLELDFIYNITLALTFIYYNNNKSIKLPAALHLCNRRNMQFRRLETEWLSYTPSISY
jgi:hypothetical protein